MPSSPLGLCANYTLNTQHHFASARGDGIPGRSFKLLTPNLLFPIISQQESQDEPRQANTTCGNKRCGAANSARSQQNALPCAGWFCGHPGISSFPPPYCLNNEKVLEDSKEKGTTNVKNQAGENQGTLDKQVRLQPSPRSTVQQLPERLQWAQVLFC